MAGPSVGACRTEEPREGSICGTVYHGIHMPKTAQLPGSKTPPFHPTAPIPAPGRRRSLHDDQHQQLPQAFLRHSSGDARITCAHHRHISGTPWPSCQKRPKDDGKLASHPVPSHYAVTAPRPSVHRMYTSPKLIENKLTPPSKHSMLRYGFNDKSRRS